MICKEKTACFTGHRNLATDPARLFAQVSDIVEDLIGHGYRYFGAGGARGFAALASEAVLALKEDYPQIHLILVLPFPNQYRQEGNWTAEEITQYHRLQKQASKVVYTQRSYSTGCYYARNRHLVDYASVCIAYQCRPFGGTAYTTSYAKSRGVRLLYVG